MGELKAENWAAARELLERQPHRAADGDRDGALERFARLHAAQGDRAFRLKTGLLEPGGPIAEAEGRYDRGEITAEGYAAAVQTYLGRAPDEALFDTYYKDLFERADAVAMLLRRTIDRFEPAADEDLSRAMRDAAAHLAAAQIPSGLSKRELDAADRFAAETRIELRIAPAEYGPHCETHAAALVRGAARSLLDFLTPMISGRIPTARLRALFDEWKRGDIPHPNKLRAAIDHERVGVLLALRKRAEDAKAGAPTPEKSPRDPEDAPIEKEAKCFRVDGWSQLRIGTDGSRILAFAPKMEIGDSVQLAWGVPLALPGDRWRTLIGLACGSRDGRTVPQAEFVRHCRTIDPARMPSERPDSRSRRSRTRKSISRTESVYLSSLLCEFRSDLALLIDGPPANAKTVLVRCGDNIDMVLTMQALLRDDSGHYTFGSRRSS